MKQLFLISFSDTFTFRFPLSNTFLTHHFIGFSTDSSRYSSTDPFRYFSTDPFRDPFGDPFRDPFTDPFTDPFRDPFTDPFRDPFRGDSIFSIPCTVPQRNYTRPTELSSVKYPLILNM